MAFPRDLQECLQSFLNDKTCLMQKTRRPKRSIFGANDHDDLRQVTSVFEKFFRNILNHEKIRKNELQSMKHRIQNEESGLNEIRSYLKSLQTIERIHRLQTDLYLLFVGNLEILYRDLRESDFISIMTLFKSKKCQFISKVNSCVTLSNFVIEDFWVHGTYFHRSPQWQNFS